MSGPEVLRQYGRTVTGRGLHPIVWAIRHGREFVAGALSATACPNGTGKLPAPHVDHFHRDRPGYVVYSYKTPIAWQGPRGWTFPDERYSPTTSRHQGFVAVAINAGQGQAS